MSEWKRKSAQQRAGWRTRPQRTEGSGTEEFAPPFSSVDRQLMTQTLTLINQFGAWQSADFRLTAPDGAVTNDFSPKQVHFWCTDGTALVSYAGLGSVFPKGKDGPEVQISDWMRALLRGERHSLNSMFNKLLENATADLGQHFYNEGKLHQFSVAAFFGSKPCVVEVRNFRLQKHAGQPELLNRFVAWTIPITDHDGAAGLWPPLPTGSEDF